VKEGQPEKGSLRWQALVVEDDDDTRASVAGTLFDYGLGVREARHGADALALLGEGYRPDVIVLDLMMPVMNGWDFLAAKNRDRQLAGIPVIVVTANDGKAPLERVAEVVRKPIDAGQLLEAIVNAGNRRD